MQCANQSAVMAVSPGDGIVKYAVQEGAFNREDFRNFMILLCEIMSRNAQNVCFVFANCGIHSEEALAALKEEYSYDYWFLPPTARSSTRLRKCSVSSKIISGDCLRRTCISSSSLCQVCHGQKTENTHLWNPHVNPTSPDQISD
jgi:hypothetical protein